MHLIKERMFINKRDKMHKVFLISKRLLVISIIIFRIIIIKVVIKMDIRILISIIILIRPIQVLQLQLPRINSFY